MIAKHPIVENRIRTLPKQFSWIDHRLVRDGHIRRCSVAGAALYLFLVTVGDARGLSYWSDAAITDRLCMGHDVLQAARANLTGAGLIAFKAPLYQVLSLHTAPKPRQALSEPVSLAAIFKNATGGLP
jgi:hypothetical protein